MSGPETRPAATEPAVERRPAGGDASGAIPVEWVQRYGLPPADNADEQRRWLLNAIASEERRVGGPVVRELSDDGKLEVRSAPLASAVGGNSAGMLRGAMSVRGIAVPFNGLSSNLGGFRERFARGAFAGQVPKFEGVFSTLQHDRDVVLGTTRAKTLRFKVELAGLEFGLDLPESSYVRSLVARGDLHGASVGFVAKRDRWTEEGGEAIRTVEEARLVEVALVHLPAYPDALVAIDGTFGPKKRSQGTPALNIARRRHALRERRGANGALLPQSSET